MPSWIIGLIQFIAGAVVTLAVQLLSSRELRWKTIEDRRSDYARRREPLYAKALEFVFAIEGARPKEELVSRVLQDYADWLIPNTFYFPPSAKEKLFTLRTNLVIYLVDLSNKAVEKETVRAYANSIEEAKEYFLNSRDISWFPEELAGGRSKK